MSEQNDIEIRPDRDAMRVGLELAIVKKRKGGRLSKDDRRLIGRVMKLLEPLFVNAERGEYPLYPKSRLKKEAVARAISIATRSKVGRVEFISYAAPIPCQEWMSGDAHEYCNELGFAQVVRRSVDPWLETVLGREFAPIFAHGHADKEAADALIRSSFGNKLYTAINTGLFSGAMYPVESALIHFIAFALTGSESMTEMLTPLMRLLPRAIPLGKRSDREDIWNVLVA